MDAEVDPATRRTSPGEWLAAAALLLALGGIVLAIYLARRTGAPPAPSAPPATAPAAADLAALLPAPDNDSPFRILVPARHWPADKMHQKINGEDRAYLKHGCLGLAAATLSNPDSGVTLDVYLYQMTAAASAEAVFDEQAPRQDAPAPRDRPNWIDLGDKAYTSYGCCYVRAGAFYLKVIPAAETPLAQAEAMKLARQFVSRLAATLRAAERSPPAFAVPATAGKSGRGY